MFDFVKFWSNKWKHVRLKLKITNKRLFHDLKDAALETKLRKTRSYKYNNDPEFRAMADKVLEGYNQEMKRINLLDVSTLEFVWKLILI